MRNDVVLKEMLQHAPRAIQALGGAHVNRWINIDMAQIKALRPDLVGERQGGGIFHLEIMTKNEPNAPVRMLEYNVTIQVRHRNIPDQVLLYIGYNPMRMNDRISAPDLSFRFRLVDARDLNGDALLDSPELGDNMIAVLGRLRNQRSAVREILSRMRTLSPVERDKAFTGLLIMAGLRRLGALVYEEAEYMPFDIDVTENEAFMKLLDRKAERMANERAELMANEMAERMANERAERMANERAERMANEMAERMANERMTAEMNRVTSAQALAAKRELLTHLIERRYGSLNPAQSSRLSAMTSEDLETAALRIFDCHTVDELLN